MQCLTRHTCILSSFVSQFGLSFSSNSGRVVSHCCCGKIGLSTSFCCSGLATLAATSAVIWCRHIARKRLLPPVCLDLFHRWYYSRLLTKLSASAEARMHSLVLMFEISEKVNSPLTPLTSPKVEHFHSSNVNLLCSVNTSCSVLAAHCLLPCNKCEEMVSCHM